MRPHIGGLETVQFVFQLYFTDKPETAMGVLLDSLSHFNYLLTRRGLNSPFRTFQSGDFDERTSNCDIYFCLY